MSPESKIPELIVALDGKSLEESEQIIGKLAKVQEKVQGRLQIIVKFNDLFGVANYDQLAKIMAPFPNLGVMLDPKWHNIDATDRNFVMRLVSSGLAPSVRYLTMHPESFAVPGSYAKTIGPLLEKFPQIRTLGISFLTTLGDAEARRTHGKPALGVVLDNAHLALKEGFHGVVSSAQEAPMLRQTFGGVFGQFSDVTPGVRFAGSDHGTQKRVVTPRRAFENGASAIVMGSDILKCSEGIEAAVMRVLEEAEGAEYIEQKIPRFDPKLEFLAREGSIPEILTHIGATYDRPEHFPAGHGYVRWDSGVITNKYTNLAVLERHPQALERVSRDLANSLNQEGIKPHIIVGAEKGSIRLSDRLGQMMGVDAIYAEKGPGDTMIFDRHEIPDEMLEEGVVDVVICEDVISRGGTVEKIITALKARYGDRVRIVGIASVGRNTVNQVNFGDIPFVSLTEISKPSEVYYDDTSLHGRDGVQKSGEICAKLMQNPEFPYDSALVGSGKKYVGALQRMVREGRGGTPEDFDGVVSQK